MSRKTIQAGLPPAIAPPFAVNDVPLPAVALFVNVSLNTLPIPGAAIKFCVTPELFVMPTPLMLSAKSELAVIVKLLAPGAKVIPSTVVFAEIEMAVVFETANVAVSADPLGTVAGVQFVAVFQSPEPGLRSHIALPARANPAKQKRKPQLITATTNLFLEVIFELRVCDMIRARI